MLCSFMAAYSPHLPTIFGALSDPTRLAVVTQLLKGPASVSSLAEPHGIARQSFMKHLKVLEIAGVVRSRKKGRVRTVALSPNALAQVEDWASLHRARAESELDRLGEFLKTENGDDG